jgi:hypothetical protein
VRGSHPHLPRLASVAPLIRRSGARAYYGRQRRPAARSLATTWIRRTSTFAGWLFATVGITSCVRSPASHAKVSGSLPRILAPSSLPPVAPSAKVPAVEAEIEWHPILSDEDGSVNGRTFGSEQAISVSPFEGGAVLSSRSFLAVVIGRDVRQDPRWLAGLPDYLNWSWWTVSELRVPIESAPASAAELPRGAAIVIRSGWLGASLASLLDPEVKVWNGQHWARSESKNGELPLDERLLAVKGRWVQLESSSLPEGELTALGVEASENSMDALPTGAADGTWSKIPSPKDGSAPVQNSGSSAQEYVFCASTGPQRDTDRLFRLRAGAWSAVHPPTAGIRSCTATPDGTLWLQTGDGALNRLPPGRAWQRVAVPPRMDPRRIRAGGDRLWLIGESIIYSNAPVTVPLRLSAVQAPFADEGAAYRIDRRVSRSLAGPGTSACSSLVVHLASRASKALKTALAQSPELSQKPLLEVGVSVPGTAVRAGGEPTVEVLRYVPGSGSTTAVAMNATSIDEAMRIAAELVPYTSPAPRIVCGIPNVVRTLSAGAERSRSDPDTKP